MIGNEEEGKEANMRQEKTDLMPSIIAEPNLESCSVGHISRTAKEQDIDLQSLSGPPTADPVAALRFCQYLARLLTTNHGLPITEVAESISPDTDVGSGQAGLTRPDLSVVIPVYNEEENISALYARLTSVLEKVGGDYEIVFVDDGSRDKSLAVLQALAAHNHRVIIVELGRNFGHQAAITAGLDHTRGNAVIVMDADLQDPPEELPRFIAKWREGHDVVYAIREQRKEGWCKRTAYAIFYRLLQRVAKIHIPLDAGDFCLMDRRVVDLLGAMPERNRFVRGIRSWIGLDQVGISYERHARHAGTPKYTIGRLIALALDGLVSFSYIPLRTITLLGFSISLCAIALAVFYTVKKLTVGLNPPGFATLVVAIFFLAGIQLITMGVMGEYVGRIFEEVKQRPLYIVRRVIGKRY